MQKNLKFLCNYGGKFIPRYFDDKLRYFGRPTRVLAVDRSISFSELGEFTGEPGLYLLTLRCQLLEPDLDYALVSIVSDEDLSNLIEEYDLVVDEDSAFLSILRFQSPPLLSSSSSSF
ncbi:hypothetical protein LINPERPRIM_LOCUS3253 [Linum perenne]